MTEAPPIADEDDADETWEAEPAELAPDEEASHHAILDDRPVIVSAFAGIGGFDLGFERAGFQTGAVIEWDAAASRVLAARFPNAARFSDVRNVNGESVRRAIGGRQVAVLSGGFPCQDLSVAGRRAGMAGKRSGLYGELLRLAEELDPDWLVVENVPGIFSADADPEANDGEGYGPGTGFALFLGDVTGYRPPVPDGGWRNSGVCSGPIGTCAWRVLDARHFGVAQRRRRMLAVVNTRDRRASAAVLLEPEGMRRDPAPGRPTWARAAATPVGAAVRGRPGGADRGGEDGVVANALTRNGLGGGPDDNLAQGNHLVPLAADVRNGLLDEDVTGGRDPEVGGIHEYPDGNVGYEPHAPTLTAGNPGKVVDGRPIGAVEAETGEDIGPTVTTVFAKGNGGYAGMTEHRNLIAHGVDTYNASLTGEVAHPVRRGGEHSSGGSEVPHIIVGHGEGDIVGHGEGDVPAQGVDTYNGDVTGEVAHTLRANAGPEGVPAVTTETGQGARARDAGEGTVIAVAGSTPGDIATAVTARQHKGTPDSDATGTLVAMRESGQGFWTEDDEAATLRVGGDPGTVVTVVGDGGTEVSHPVTASGTDGMGRGVPAVAFRTDQSFDDGIASGVDVAMTLTDRNMAVAPGTAYGISSDAIDCTGEGAAGDAASRAGLGILEEASPTLRTRAQAVAYTPDVAAPLTAGSHSPGVSAPGRRQEDDVNVVAAYRKSRRAQTNEDDETWVEADHANTLNTFDGGDTRATEVVIERAQGVHLTQDPIHGDEFTPALSAKSGGQGLSVPHASVRRLTPRECERLQSFPDDWTLVLDAKGRPASDSPRYKQLGNAVCCNVAEWLALQIRAYDDGVTTNPTGRWHPHR